MSDTSMTLDAVLRLGMGVVNGWLVLLIGAQGAALGAALIGVPFVLNQWMSWWPSFDASPLVPWIAGALAIAGALGGGALAGWRVLGGWRGARRATFVVAIGAACGWGTFASPLLLDQRPINAWVFGFAAAFMAAAAGGVAMLRPPAPEPRDDVPALERELR